MKDYYLILGVPRSENARGIRKAFLEQAKACHPDRTGSGGSSFRDVAEAYEVLSDPEKRRRYDAGRSPSPIRPIPAEPPTPRRTNTPTARRSGHGRPEPEPLIPESPRSEPRQGLRPEPLVPEPPRPFDLRPSSSGLPTADDLFLRWLRALMGR